MSDAIFERIAVALETIAKNGKLAPAAAGAGANKGTSSAGASGAAAGGNKATPASNANKATPASNTNKGASGVASGAGANKGAANKGGTPAAAKAPGGKWNSEQVRDIIRKVATNPSLGKQSALDILDQDGGGVTNVTNLKPENFDKVYEACQALLSSEGDQTGGDAVVDDFDPTA